MHREQKEEKEDEDDSSPLHARSIDCLGTYAHTLTTRDELDLLFARRTNNPPVAHPTYTYFKSRTDDRTVHYDFTRRYEQAQTRRNTKGRKHVNFTIRPPLLSPSVERKPLLGSRCRGEMYAKLPPLHTHARDETRGTFKIQTDERHTLLVPNARVPRKNAE